MHFLVAFQLQLRFFPQGVAAGTALAPTSARAQQGVNENDPIVWIQTNFRKKKNTHQISCGFRRPAFHQHGQVLELPCAFWARPVFSRRTLDRPSSRQPLWMISCPWFLGSCREGCRENTEEERCVFSDKHHQWVGHV